MEQLPIDSYILQCKQNNCFRQKTLASVVLYIFRLFTKLFFLSLFLWSKVKKDPLKWTKCREIQLIMKLKTFFILEFCLNN